MNMRIPVGTGKDRDPLITAMLHYEGSTVVIDPKDHLAPVCGPYLVKRGNRVFAFDPFHIPASGKDAKSKGRV